MHSVTVSSRYQVVIPKEIRESLNLKPGQKMRVFEQDEHIILVPDKPITELRGFAKGMNTDFEREPDRF